MATNAAFRLGVSQGEKLRAWSPHTQYGQPMYIGDDVYLPKRRGHKAQLANRARNSGFDFAFV